jgi:hypothetical protein
MGTMNRRRPFWTFAREELDANEEENHVRTDQLRHALRKIRRLTHQLEDALARQPLALLGLVAGGGFVVGALTASRLARGLAAIGLGFALGRGGPLLERLRARSASSP